MGVLRRKPASLIAIASALATLALAAPASGQRERRHQHEHRMWYVRATARAGGNGSRRAPFKTLAAIERASNPGDVIVVLPSPHPLDGGIALKPRQTLTGAGTRSRIENTTASRHSGDAVELAKDATVKNLAIGPSLRGAVYGSDVTGVTVSGNDVSQQNTSCAVGFVVLPFVLPTTLPGVGIPFSGGLSNGWAGIMVDEDRVAGRVVITHNFVHDGDCGDGIDVRLRGSARVTARITRNRVTRLKQGQQFMSVLAIGMQTQDSAKLTATLDANSETYIGSGPPVPGAGADSEGLFANLAGRSVLDATVQHNTWQHGIGAFSVNGMEMVISSGDPRARMRISDSSFFDGPGDLLEEINFGTNATMTLDLERVTAMHSTGLGNTYAIPGNNGDCLVVGHSGAGDSTSLRMRNTRLSDCMNNGLTLASGVDNGSSGAAGGLSFDIDSSAITGNRGDNLRVVTENALTNLIGRVRRTNLSNAGMFDVALDQLGGTTAHTALDFGGGNCIYGGGVLDAETTGYSAGARGNWWRGEPRTLAVAGALDTSGALAQAPTACAPQ